MSSYYLIDLIFDVAFVAIGYWWGKGSRRHQQTWLVLVKEGADDGPAE